MKRTQHPRRIAMSQLSAPELRHANGGSRRVSKEVASNAAEAAQNISDDAAAAAQAVADNLAEAMANLL